MVDRITGSVAREAILAAIRDQTDAARSVQDDARRMFEAALDPSGSAPGNGGPQAGGGPREAAGGLGGGLRAIDSEVRAASPDRLAADLLSGELTDFHEVALRVNRARISFEFAMEIRNKLIEAYRETMRMTV